MQRFCSASNCPRVALLQRIGSVLATVTSHPAAMENGNDAGRPGAGRRSMDWEAAFLSGDPAMQWAAACSVAQAVAGHDRWVDSTAVHEARIGAYETAVAAVQSDPDLVVPAAVAGARRALYWERTARSQLVPPSSLDARRWRNQPPDAGAVKLVPLSAAAEADRGYPTGQVPMAAAGAGGHGSSALDEVAARLVDRGWRWPVPAAYAVGDAVQAVLAVGRDRAAASLASIHGDLPRVVTEGLVMLVAGSRMRTSRPWAQSATTTAAALLRIGTTRARRVSSTSRSMPTRPNTSTS